MGFAHRIFRRRSYWATAILTGVLLAGVWSARATGVQPTPAKVLQPPPQQAYTLSPDKLAQAIALSRIRDTIEIAGSLWGIVFLWLMLELRVWAAIERWVGRLTSRRWWQGVWFFFAFFVLTTLAGLPLDAYGHWASRKFGVSVQGWAGWLGDQAKALGLTLIFGTLVLMLFHWIVRRWPRRYWLGVWLATLPIVLLSIFASPLIIDPLFNKFEPLEAHHAALVARLEQVVARTGIDIPPSRMFLMKASAKSNGINAYVTGIGASKRYVMWDTTVNRLPDDEILFIFGHESGHYVLHHIPKMIAGMFVGLFFLYWACAGAAAWMMRRRGARWGGANLASRAGFVVLLLAVSIGAFLAEPAANAFSRHFEHQADIYGQEAIHGLVKDPQKTAVAAFHHLGEAWLEDPNPNPFIEFWLYSHPSVEQRAEFAAHYDPWANGGHGKYFAH